MKTLDEVIEAYEICLNNKEGCGSCPYDSIEDNRCNVWQKKSDALHYLKEYRETKKHLACLDGATLHGDDTQIVNNPPLSWNELRQMGGKPVWITYEDCKGGWVIVGKTFSLFENDEPDAYIYMHYLKNKIECSKELYGSYWQAYRKER